MNLIQSAHFTENEKRVLLKGLLPLSSLHYRNHTLLMKGLLFQKRLNSESCFFNYQDIQTFKKVVLAIIASVSETENGFAIWGDSLRAADSLLEQTLVLFR